MLAFRRLLGVADVSESKRLASLTLEEAEARRLEAPDPTSYGQLAEPGLLQAPRTTPSIVLIRTKLSGPPTSIEIKGVTAGLGSGGFCREKLKVDQYFPPPPQAQHACAALIPFLLKSWQVHWSVDKAESRPPHDVRVHHPAVA
jgi:hypothetical protein